LRGKRIDDEAQENKTITEIIGGTNYTFDSNDCALMFKKFRNVPKDIWHLLVSNN